MRLRRDIGYWPSVLWWAAVLMVAVPLKYHYSTATVADLEWVFRPLARLLEWYTGHTFYNDGSDGWVSANADVRLVKACAGVNFMLMSFLAYAWVFRPVRGAGARPVRWNAKRAVLLAAALLASWATCLLANSLRIVVAMSLQPGGWHLHAIGLGEGEVHRLTGMAIYLPLLSLQMILGEGRAGRAAAWAPPLLYVVLMVVVPLLTGNVLRDPSLFIRHVLSVSVMVALMSGFASLCRYRLSDKQRESAPASASKTQTRRKVPDRLRGLLAR